MVQRLLVSLYSFCHGRSDTIVYGIFKLQTESAKLWTHWSQLFCRGRQEQTLGVLGTLIWTHPREHNSKRATYHQWWCAPPTKRALVTHSPYILHKNMFLNLPRDVICSTARFRLCVHTLRFERHGIKVIPPSVTCVILIMSKMSSMFFSTAPIPTWFLSARNMFPPTRAQDVFTFLSQQQ